MRLVAAAACAFVCALATASSSFAHIGVTPGFLVADGLQTLSLRVHNDVDRPMTGLTVTAPTGLQIRGAATERDWQSVVEGGTVAWTGGPLAPNMGETFALDVEAEAAEPGPVVLQAQQLYSGGGSLPWQISVTLVPAEDDPQRLTWAIVVGAVLLATGGVALLALRRRRSLQEG